MVPTARKNRLCEQLGFNHDQPYDFAVFSVSFYRNYMLNCADQIEKKKNLLSSQQWQQSKRNQVSGPYILYRFLAAALFLSVVVYCGARSNHPEYWLIYLSHIGLILQTLHLTLSAAVPVQLLLLSDRGNIYTQCAHSKTYRNP